MNWLKKLLLAGLLLVVATPAAAALRVAATTPNMGMLARTVGGEHVVIDVLAPGDRDVHHLEARPSMMVALRRADLVVAVGAELEGGWLPAALQGASNPAVLPGRPGYFEAAAAVTLADAGGPADRGLGDVHPMGNPHVYFDPLRMGVAAEALARQLAVLDPAHAGEFAANAAAFAARMQQETAGWRERAAGAPGVLLNHKDAVYLLRRLDVPLLGYLEPLPGIPATARHVRALIDDLRGREGLVMRMGYEPAQGAERVGEALGWPVYEMRNNVPVDGGADDYVAVIDSWVSRLESH
ncbi:zinc ABC transporter substrate-binding protein [Wenzhouxiangella sp. XN24]|uniref:metal ABC transporter substrate-binding protein n=1 Tax=Wenzhouxiangella sp. XN24 TaxID=2713569 RepID=UPI0013EB1976|nr:zinc ABC transporter substrate-binding protein [Wenzhouxiangella sp. XN24]NGX14746.1 zinc ABC transporter solute-binding protein [Wenzhouxiangella sp. XN24]